MTSSTPRHFVPPERRTHGAELPLWTVLLVAAGVLVVGLKGERSSAEDGGQGVVHAAAKDGAGVTRVAAAAPRGSSQLDAVVLVVPEAFSRVKLGTEDDGRGLEAVSHELCHGLDAGTTESSAPLVEAGVEGRPVSAGRSSESGPYRNGLRHGEWVVRDGNGTVRERGEFAEGRKVGAWETFDAMGLFMESVEYVAGERHGDWRAYGEDGTLVGEGAHENNLRSGLWELRYSDGRIKERGTYANGLREGLWEFFDDLGERTHRSGTYRAGIKID